MNNHQWVFLLEERSAKSFLESLLPRLLVQRDDIEYCLVAFEGKQSLMKGISSKIRAWQIPYARFIILHDQDANDCVTLKANIRSIVETTGKKNVTTIRIACKELETFYLGDLQAVSEAYTMPKLSTMQEKAKYRNPDRLENPNRLLTEITNGQYQKIEGSRRIGKLISIERNHHNTSRSFQVLLETLYRFLDANTPTC
jgi:hypothetical protein